MEEFIGHQPEEELSSGPVQRPAGKAPSKTKRVRVEEEEASDDELPDLIEFFDEFNVPPEKRLALCAATAGYYRALLRKPKKK